MKGSPESLNSLGSLECLDSSGWSGSPCFPEIGGALGSPKFKENIKAFHSDVTLEKLLSSEPKKP